MKIGGFQQTSLQDFPNVISAILWTSGCNFRCPFCYNKSLALGTAGLFPEEDIHSFLMSRKGKLDGVVISGGEPLLQDDIVEFIEKIKTQGFLVKLDTNGSHPEKLKELLDNKLLDYVAMDIKAPKEKYDTLAGVHLDISLIEDSITLIKTKAPQYEFKTTFVPHLLVKEDIIEIAQWLKGADWFFLQQFKPLAPLVCSSLEETTPYTIGYLQETLKEIQPYFKNCTLRGVKKTK